MAGKSNVFSDQKAVEAFRVFFAFTAFIAFIWVFIRALNPPSKKAYNPQKAYANHQISAKEFVPPPDIDPETQEPKEYTEKQIEQWRAQRSDLAAQWETADMAHLAFRVAALGMILLGWTIFETRSAANSAAETLEIAENANSLTSKAIADAQEVATAENRAWIDIIDLSVTLHHMPPFPTTEFSIEYTIKNVGKSPALSIGIQDDLKVTSGGLSLDYSLISGGKPAKSSILPGNEFTFTQKYWIRPPAAGGNYEPTPVPIERRSIFGEIEYLDGISQTVRKTKFFHIVGPLSGNLSQQFNIAAGEADFIVSHT